MGDIWNDHRLQQLGKRITSRLRIRLTAKLISTIETLSVELCDLSYFGARLTCRTPPLPGTEVVLQWDRFEAFGVVVWSSPNSSGIRFYDPIEPSVLIATRDLDEIDHIQSQYDISRRAAQAFVNGQIRR